MLFSEMLTEYIDLREEENNRGERLEAITAGAERARRMNELLAEMDFLVAKLRVN